METLLPYEKDDDLHAEKKIVLGSFSITIEAATEAGRAVLNGSSKPNEDAFAVVHESNSVIAGVFDGASSQKIIPELEPISGARFASHSLKEALETLDLDTGMKQLLSRLNQTLGEKLTTFPSINLLDVNSLPTSTATVAKINIDTQIIEIGHVGDSFAIALMKDGSTQLLTNNLHWAFDKKVLGLIGDIASEQKISQREARNDPRIKEAIMASHQFERNRPDGRGSGSVNSDPNMDRYIHTSSIPLTEIKALLIGSDGLIPPNRSEQNEDDQKWLFETIESKGLVGLIQAIRQIEDNDPDWRYVRYKHSDDATAVLLRIDPK